MAAYRRWFRAGGTYLSTLVCEWRALLFADAVNVDRFRSAVARCRVGMSFDVVAAAVLPDQVHLILTLPDGDDDFSTRRRFIQPNFTNANLEAGGAP